MAGREGRRPIDEAFDALAHVRRRELLVALVHHGPGTRLSVDDVCRSERSESVDPSLPLRHVHLPKLESSGLVTWDRTRHKVSRGPAFRTIEPVLELLDEHDDDLPDGWLPDEPE